MLALQLHDHNGLPLLMASIAGGRLPSGAQLPNATIWVLQAVADIVRTTLGPRAMLKMLLDASGGIVLTNDGNAILREIDVSHPAAKVGAHAVCGALHCSSGSRVQQPLHHTHCLLCKRGSSVLALLWVLWQGRGSRRPPVSYIQVREEKASLPSQCGLTLGLAFFGVGCPPLRVPRWGKEQSFESSSHKLCFCACSPSSSSAGRRTRRWGTAPPQSSSWVSRQRKSQLTFLRPTKI